ncbi:MAG TPA: M67 family metallopeptidase [Vicinamibacterales bacterium]
MDAVQIRARVLDAIVAHARRISPEECCGILIGRSDEQSSEIVDATPARNISPRPTVRFLVEPRDHLDALRDARQRNLAVVGFYHSHPRTAPAPSETDLAEATYPNHLFLIVGLRAEPPELRLYRFRDGNFHGVPLVTVAG